MPQLGNIVLTDRAATPVNHTFTPKGIVDNVGTVVKSSGVPIGDPRFSVSMKQNGNGNYKGEIRLAVPVVQTQTINGVSTPVVVRTAYASLTFTFDPSSSEQERKDCVGMLQSSLDATKALVNDAIVKLESVY